MSSQEVPDFSQFSGKLRDTIQSALLPTETVLFIAKEITSGATKSTYASTGILIITNSRVVYVESIDIRWSGATSLLTGKSKVDTFFRSQITSISRKPELMLGMRITIALTGQESKTIIVRHNDSLAEQICRLLQ